MTFTLTNQTISISVSATGAELQSLTATASGEQYLWSGDSTIWSGRAPILFPIVGALKQSRMNHRGKHYSLPRHGLARRMQFDCVESSDSHLLFNLHSNETTLDVYPWDFSLEAGYKLNGNRLEVSYKVTHNTSPTSDDDMLFTIGSHPAFCLPLEEMAMDQFQIRFSHPEHLQKYPLDENGLLSVAPEHYPLTDNSITLQKTLFDDDALVFKNIKSDSISLWQQGCERIRVNTGGAPHLGIWAKPGASFVCIEPWFGYSDATDACGRFTDKPALMQLAGGKSFQTNWSIELPSIQR